MGKPRGRINQAERNLLYDGTTIKKVEDKFMIGEEERGDPIGGNLKKSSHIR